MIMTKEKINEIALKVISDSDIWNCSSDEKKTAQVVAYTSGVVKMARAIAQELENEKHE